MNPCALKRTTTGPTKPAHRYLIEGEYVTVAQIAQRISKSPGTAWGRLNKLRSQPGPVTWAALHGSAQ